MQYFFDTLRPLFLFSSNNHVILKLKRVGITGSHLSLLTNYLGAGHFQRLVIEGCLSDCRATVLFGVPQGSILGTLLVILFFHDINRLPILTEICAYHTQVVYRVPSSTIPDTVQESLQRIAEQCCTWSLRTNTG